MGIQYLYGMVSIKKTLEAAHQALDGAGIDHALIGGLAVAAHGVQQSTIDVDLLIRDMDSDAAERALIAAGFTLKERTPETLHFGTLGPLDVLLARRPPSQAMLDEALSREGAVRLLRVEDIIGLKIQAMVNAPRRRARDEADIQALLALPGKLDWDRIHRYADAFDERETIKRLRKAIEL